MRLTGYHITSLTPWIMFGVSMGLIIQAYRLVVEPQEFRSTAKLTAEAHPQFRDDRFRDTRPTTLNLATTIVEMVESSEMRRLALERTRALNPEVKPCDVNVRASQVKDSGMFIIQAAGADPKYIKIYLDALLDEFINFRQRVREHKLAQHFGSIFDRFLEKRTKATNANPADSKQAVEKLYSELFEQLGWFKSYSEDAGDYVVIFERAGPASEAATDWTLSLLLGASFGAVGGSMLRYVVLMLSSLRSLLADT